MDRRSLALAIALVGAFAVVYFRLSRDIHGGAPRDQGSDLVRDPAAPLVQIFEVDGATDVLAPYEARLPEHGSLFLDTPPVGTSMPLARARVLRVGPTKGERETDTWNRTRAWLGSVPLPAGEHFVLQRLLDQAANGEPTATGWWRTHLLRGAPLANPEDITSATFDRPIAGAGGSSGRITLNLSPAAVQRLAAEPLGANLALVIGGVVEAAPWMQKTFTGTKLTVPVDPRGREAEIRGWVEELNRARPD